MSLSGENSQNIIPGELVIQGTIDHDGAKAGFFSKAPGTQPVHLADPTDLATCITAISTIIDELKALGLMEADP